MIRPGDDITAVKGIGDKTAAPFRRAGVFCVGDLLGYYPSSYRSYPEVSDAILAPEGSFISLCAPIKGMTERYVNSKLITTANISVAGSQAGLIWFNQRFLKKTLKPGVRYVFFGKLSYKGRGPQLLTPQVFAPEEYERLRGSLRPVYPKVFGLTDRMLERAEADALLRTSIDEFLPGHILERYSLIGEKAALDGIHFPKDREMLADARKRLSFDEFFDFILSQKFFSQNEGKVKNPLKAIETSVVERIKAALPYSLTEGQEKALSDLLGDFGREYVTQRLIQGDVGSGKTIVAFIAMAVMAQNGCTSAIMAPTEVLARQHYEKFSSLCRDIGLDVPCILLTSQVKGKARAAALEEIASGVPSFVIGTHAIFQEKVSFKNLSLVITDEQHRFGVRQRSALVEKGSGVFSVVMSATPIPRTLAMILYQGMDISTIREKPSNRIPCKNAVIDPSLRKNAYSLLVKEIRAGHQGMIICPLVEPSENSAGADVESYYEKMRQVLPDDITIGKLYGPMPSDQKEQAMEDFASGKTSLLISTTVIEVGVDVPNATVIMIEDAQRFGLAQLHQLRGRVGRGDAASYCIFVDTSGAETVSKRLLVLKESNDGFYLAEADLKLRGPGDTFGLRQSGSASFKIADIYSDRDLLIWAKEAVDELASNGIENIPGLSAHLREMELNTYVNL